MRKIEKSYNRINAIHTVYSMLSKEVRRRLSLIDVLTILNLLENILNDLDDLEDEARCSMTGSFTLNGRHFEFISWADACDYPREVNWLKIHSLVISSAEQIGIPLTLELLYAVTDAEMEYMTTIGMAGSMDELLN